MEFMATAPMWIRGYIQCGDFNLGTLITVYEDNHERKCQHGVILNRRMQYVEAITYAVNAVNRNKNLLGNFTLGFAILKRLRWGGICHQHGH